MAHAWMNVVYLSDAEYQERVAKFGEGVTNGVKPQRRPSSNSSSSRLDCIDLMETMAASRGLHRRFWHQKVDKPDYNPTVGDFPTTLQLRESAMNSRMVLRLATVAALAAGGAMVSAQGPASCPAPLSSVSAPASRPPTTAGSTIQTAHIHSLSATTTATGLQEVDIPIGPDNHFEPGDPDRGQPTHFLPNRNFGMFSITVPKATPATERSVVGTDTERRHRSAFRFT